MAETAGINRIAAGIHTGLANVGRARAVAHPRLRNLPWTNMAAAEPEGRGLALPCDARQQTKTSAIITVKYRRQGNLRPMRRVPPAVVVQSMACYWTQGTEALAFEPSSG